MQPRRRREDPNEPKSNQNQQTPDGPNQRPVLERVAKPPAWSNQRMHHRDWFFLCQFRSGFHNQVSTAMQAQINLIFDSQLAQLAQIQGMKGETRTTSTIDFCSYQHSRAQLCRLTRLAELHYRCQKLEW